MPVQKLDQWAQSKVQQTFPLSTLKDAVIGVDASYYLDLRLNATPEEPLKHALGGVPFCLRKIVVDDLQILKDAGVGVVFVFNGLDFVNKTPSDAQSLGSNRARENGWSKYHSGDADAVVQHFSQAKFPVDHMQRYLQKLLIEHNIDFMVAPYSAIAQLSYMVKLSDQYIDTILGSTEFFLFNVDKVITNIDINKEEPTFDWISKSACEERLKVPGETLRDAQLLLGSTFSLPFPILEHNSAAKPSTIQEAINLLASAQRSTFQLCNMYRDDPMVSQLEYADRYKKTIMTIRHHVVLEKKGNIAPLDFEHAPGDVHEFVGQNLPEELFFYISKGLIGPAVPNWLTTGEVNLSLHGGVVDSEAYRKLVIEQLNEIRTEALKVLAETLAYYYQSRIIEVKTWDQRDTSNLTINLKDKLSLKTKTVQWKVRGPVLEKALQDQGGVGLFSCLQLLKESSFAQNTVTQTRVQHPALKTKDEVVMNTLWRFLQIRGYVNDKHELTKWGLVLHAVLDALDDTNDSEDRAILIVEMLRSGLLNGHAVDGTPVPTSDKEYRDKVNTNLLAKVGCIGRIKHKSVGYTGPLDRQLLTFAFMISALRTSLRELFETILVAMFLGGEVERDRQDWGELSQSLPLIFDNGSSLGVAVKTYLDALNSSEKITPELKDEIKSQKGNYQWFLQIKGGTLGRSTDLAWSTWDAVYAGVQQAGRDVKDSKLFADANEWLEVRR